MLVVLEVHTEKFFFNFFCCNTPCMTTMFFTKNFYVIYLKKYKPIDKTSSHSYITIFYTKHQQKNK